MTERSRRAAERFAGLPAARAALRFAQLATPVSIGRSATRRSSPTPSRSDAYCTVTASQMKSSPPGCSTTSSKRPRPPAPSSTAASVGESQGSSNRSQTTHRSAITSPANATYATASPTQTRHTRSLRGLPPADAKRRIPSRARSQPRTARSSGPSNAPVSEQSRSLFETTDPPCCASSTRPSGAPSMLRRRQAHHLRAPRRHRRASGTMCPSPPGALSRQGAKRCNRSDPERRRYRCLSPEAPPACRRAAQAARFVRFTPPIEPPDALISPARARSDASHLGAHESPG